MRSELFGPEELHTSEDQVRERGRGERVRGRVREELHTSEDQVRGGGREGAGEELHTSEDQVRGGGREGEGRVLCIYPNRTSTSMFPPTPAALTSDREFGPPGKDI